jgi:hypothetical protein
MGLWGIGWDGCVAGYSFFDVVRRWFGGLDDGVVGSCDGVVTSGQVRCSFIVTTGSVRCSDNVIVSAKLWACLCLF